VPSATVIETIETSAPSFASDRLHCAFKVRKHRHDDLAVDVVHDHQRDEQGEHRPGITARYRPLARRVAQMVNAGAHASSYCPRSSRCGSPSANSFPTA
jgi:hypothetical protein